MNVIISLPASYKSLLFSPLRPVQDVFGIPYKGVIDTAQRIYIEGDRGPRVFFAGVVPRVFWLGIGGFVFLGAYEGAKKVFNEREI